MDMISSLHAKDQQVLVEKSMFFLESHLQSWKGKLEKKHFEQLQNIALNRAEEIFAKNKSEFLQKCLKHLKNM